MLSKFTFSIPRTSLEFDVIFRRKNRLLICYVSIKKKLRVKGDFITKTGLQDAQVLALKHDIRART
jgi:hypothetical protein